MLYCAQAITEMNAFGLPTFLEPLPVVKKDENYRVVKTADALAKLVGVASALGDSSRHLWLKLPYCENYESRCGRNDAADTASRRRIGRRCDAALT